MRVIFITFLISLTCITGAVLAAPDEEPPAAKAVDRNVSIQLMDYGEGANRKIKLTLSDEWSNLPDSTRKQVLSKLKAALPEASLKKALLALARGETEIEISAAPEKKRVVTTPMVKVVPAMPVYPAKKIAVKPTGTKPGGYVRLGAPGEKMIMLGGAGGKGGGCGGGMAGQPGKPAAGGKGGGCGGGMAGQPGKPGAAGQGALTVRGLKDGDFEIEVLEIDGMDDMPQEVRKKLLEMMKRQGALRGQLDGSVRILQARPGKSGDCRDCEKDVKTEVKVMGTGNGDWRQLSPEKRKQVLQSLRRTVPQEQMADVLKALMQGGTMRAGGFHAQPMPGKADCGSRNAPRGHGRKSGGRMRCGGGNRMHGGGGDRMRCGGGNRMHGGGGDRMRCGGGNRMHGGGDGRQGALVRALVALTNEVRALRTEVAAMRATHQGRPPVLRPRVKPDTPRRMMLRTIRGAPGAAPKVIIEKPNCGKSEGECGQKPPPPPPLTMAIVTGQADRTSLGGVFTPSTGVMVMPQQDRKYTDVEQDMAKLRAEMAEMRAALQRLVKNLEKLRAEK